MATQSGILPFSGKLGSVVGYRRGKKHFSRVAAQTHQLSEESKKSASEFGKGSTAATLARTAFSPMLFAAYREQLHHRLATAFREVIRSGLSSFKGQREVYDGDIGLLKGFEFNKSGQSHKFYTASFSIKIMEDYFLLELPPLKWGHNLYGPSRTNNMVLRFSCASFDFKQRWQQCSHSAPLYISKGTSIPSASLKFRIPKISEQSILFLLSIHFTDDKQQIIQNKRHQAGCIFDAFHLLNGEVKPFFIEPSPQSPKEPVETFNEIPWTFKGG